MFRQRSQEALRLKAARGELHTTLAIGYVRGADDRLELDPDLRIREVLSLVFRKFGEIGSVRQLALWLRPTDVCLTSNASVTTPPRRRCAPSPAGRAPG